MLVSQITTPTHICIMSLTIGGTLIGLFQIVSISSRKLTRDIPIPIINTMRSRFSSNGEKSQNKKTRGESMRSIMSIDIPAPYGAGALHFSDL